MPKQFVILNFSNRTYGPFFENGSSLDVLSCMPFFKHLASKLKVHYPDVEITFDGITMCDYANKNTPGAFTNEAAQLAVQPEYIEKTKEGNIKLNFDYQATLEKNHKTVQFFDDQKLLSLYTLMHYTAEKYLNHTKLALDFDGSVTGDYYSEKLKAKLEDAKKLKGSITQEDYEKTYEEMVEEYITENKDFLDSIFMDSTPDSKFIAVDDSKEITDAIHEVYEDPSLIPEGQILQVRRLQQSVSIKKIPKVDEIVCVCKGLGSVDQNLEDLVRTANQYKQMSFKKNSDDYHTDFSNFLKSYKLGKGVELESDEEYMKSSKQIKRFFDVVLRIEGMSVKENVDDDTIEKSIRESFLLAIYYLFSQMSHKNLDVFKSGALEYFKKNDGSFNLFQLFQSLQEKSSPKESIKKIVKKLSRKKELSDFYEAVLKNITINARRTEKKNTVYEVTVSDLSFLQDHKFLHDLNAKPVVDEVIENKVKQDQLRQKNKMVIVSPQKTVSTVSQKNASSTADDFVYPDSFNSGDFGLNVSRLKQLEEGILTNIQKSQNNLTPDQLLVKIKEYIYSEILQNASDSENDQLKKDIKDVAMRKAKMLVSSLEKDKYVDSSDEELEFAAKQEEIRASSESNVDAVPTQENQDRPNKRKALVFTESKIADLRKEIEEVDQVEKEYALQINEALQKCLAGDDYQKFFEDTSYRLYPDVRDLNDKYSIEELNAQPEKLEGVFKAFITELKHELELRIALYCFENRVDLCNENLDDLEKFAKTYLKNALISVLFNSQDTDKLEKEFSQYIFMYKTAVDDILQNSFKTVLEEHHQKNLQVWAEEKNKNNMNKVHQQPNPNAWRTAENPWHKYSVPTQEQQKIFKEMDSYSLERRKEKITSWDLKTKEAYEKYLIQKTQAQPSNGEVTRWQQVKPNKSRTLNEFSHFNKRQPEQSDNTKSPEQTDEELNKIFNELNKGFQQ